MGAVVSCFKSVVNAITSCFMAVVNAIVAVLKAIVNVSRVLCSSRTRHAELTFLPGHRLRLLGHRLVPDLRQGGRTSEEGNNERGLAFVIHQQHHPIVDLDTVGKQHAFRRVRMRTFE